MLFSCSSLATEITGSSDIQKQEKKQKEEKPTKSSQSSSSTYSPLLFLNSSSPNNFTTENRTTSPKSVDSHLKNKYNWQKLGKESLVKALSAEQINFYLSASESENRKERHREAEEAKKFG